MRYDDDRNFQGNQNNRRGGRRWQGSEDYRSGSDRYDRGYEDDRRFESYGDNDSSSFFGGRAGGGYGDERNADRWSSSRYSESRDHGDLSYRGGRGMDDRYERNRDFHDRFGSGTDGFRDRASGQSYMDSGNETWRSGSANDWGTGYGRSSFSSGASSWGMPGWESGSRSERSFRDLGRDSGREFGRDYGREHGREFGRSEGRGVWEQVKDFFGVGPKGYRRSDERIREEVSEALARDSSVDASEIEVDVKEGIVHLRGHVSSRWMKRRAEDCVEHLSGVRDVRNEIDVRSEQSIGGSTSSLPGSGTSGPDQARSGDGKRRSA